uniref:Uncharacterized protein n=1 Tax=Gadus morhua TaxID=8049 RepID=A0A8C5CIH5_GADMO
VVERRSGLLHSFDPSREEEEGANPCMETRQLPQEEEEVRHLAADGSINATTTAVHGLTSDLPDDVPHEEEEGVLQTGLHLSSTFQLVVEVLQQDPDDLHQGQDQRAERQGARVEPAARGEDGVGGDVFGLLEGPVVRGEGPCQRHLPQRRHEVGAPEEEEEVVELQHDQVLVVERLAAVEREAALGVQGASREVVGAEGLWGEGGGEGGGGRSQTGVRM